MYISHQTTQAHEHKEDTSMLKSVANNADQWDIYVNEEGRQERGRNEREDEMEEENEKAGDDVQLRDEDEQSCDEE